LSQQANGVLIPNEINCLRGAFMIRSVASLALVFASPAAFAQSTLPPIPAVQDAPFPGTMTLKVDATDIDRRIFNVSQIIPVGKSGAMVLMLPEWLPGNHAPRGQIEKIAGLTITAGGKRIAWKRDPYDVFAFHIDVPSGAREIEAKFQFLSATAEDQGRVVVTDAMMNLQWQSVSLYPAGWATSRIPISASVTWPAGWKAATSLRPASTGGTTVRYQTVDYETLIDSPVFAGKHFVAYPLGNNTTLNIVADDAKFLAAKPEQIAAHQRLVDQAVKLFGTRSFDHYDFLLALTDKMGSIGLEHHRSSENGVNPEYFTDWNTGPGRRNLLPHELTHSWNGKHRRPKGQIVPTFKEPLDNSLLWVYEGQTQFWGYVLGARSGLFSKQETLDALGAIAAGLDIRAARRWRHMEDTTYDPIITARRPKGWTSWQRSEDYYNEGLLIWLEADGIIRSRTNGARGMDDFARSFFGTKDGDWSARPYDFAELVRTLNSVVPFDWQTFLTTRLSENADRAPLKGIEAGGYRLAYSDEPTPFFKDAEKRSKELNLTYSGGLTIGKGGKITSVIWDSATFNAGLAVGMEIIAVNGIVYSDDAIKDAIKAAAGGKDPIRLIIKSGDRVRDVAMQWNGGLRYPRLEKIGAMDGSLDRLLAPRP
jgi:predicted metalloprotease with PDZ domain